MNAFFSYYFKIVYLLPFILQHNLANAGCEESEEIFECLKFQIDLHRLPQDEASVFNPLGYCQFKSYEENGLITQDEAKKLVDWAYKVQNPILFRPSKREVPKDAYSLNLLWINASPLQEGGHLLGQDSASFNEKILSPLFDWQEKQPLANINLWYDSQMVPRANVDTTREILAKSNVDMAGIRLRDIREIALVQKNDSLYEEEIPIYFRVDLAKALIADHLLTTNEVDYVINIDSDIVAITKQQLFDKKSLKQLSKVGYVFGSTPGADEENSFIMLHNIPLVNDYDETTKEELKSFWQEYDVQRIPQDVMGVHRNYVIKKAISQALKSIERGRKPDEQLVFALYGVRGFRQLLNIAYLWRTGEYFRPKSRGKAIINPRSRFGVLGGYQDEEIQKLRTALLDQDECD